MSKKRLYILTIALTLIIALSSLIFLGINNNKTSIQIVSFIFIILMEIITYGIILINIIFNPLFTIKSILITNFSLLLIYLLVDTFILFFKEWS